MIRKIGLTAIFGDGILFGQSLQDSFTLDNFKVVLLGVALLIGLGLVLETVFNRKRL